MSNQLVPIRSTADFRWASLIQHEGPLTRSQQAAKELFHHFDSVWNEIPSHIQDFVLRFFRSCGLPIDYPALPFWAERAARHVFTICYPTLRKTNLNNPSPEDFGRVTGHLLAIISHAKRGSA